MTTSASAPLPASVLEALARYDTPTICNAMEIVAPERRLIGYTVKPGSESTLQVGGGTYAMYTQGDGLWIKNAAEEERMVEAMRKSADLTVKAVSAKGTETIDSFSLKGLAQALDRLGQDCRR